MRRFQAVVLTLCIVGFAARGGFCEKTVMERIKERGWDFKFKDFTVSAFVGPGEMDAEHKLYKECGFNVAISPRKLHLGLDAKEGTPEAEEGYKKIDRWLDTAHSNALAVVLETYTWNTRPWGGVDAPKYRHRSHHPATLPEIQWIHKRYGKHPAIVGYMLADDIGNPPETVAASSMWMIQNCPDLWPWMCQLDCKPHTIVAGAQGALAIPQFYPTLYRWRAGPVGQMQRYCGQMNGRLRPLSLEHATLPMPMFNVSTFWPHDPATYMKGDSVVRFQIYSSLAYGAQGIYYFTYRDFGSLFVGAPEKDDYLTAKAHCDMKWYVAKEANQRVLAWGPELVGRECREIYHSRWDMWHKSVEEQALKPGESNIEGPGKLLAKMPDDLLVGILRKKDAPPLAMVVDKRVSKEFRAIPPRDAAITFADSVTSIDILEAGGSTNVKGNTIVLNLESGDGQLLRLNEDTAEHKDVPPTVKLPARMQDLAPMREQFVGRWVQVKSGNRVAMNADGTFSLETSDGKPMDRGTWSVKGPSLSFAFTNAPFPDGYESPLLEIGDGHFVVKDMHSQAILFARMPR